jgi:hypothetical protein
MSKKAKFLKTALCMTAAMGCLWPALVGAQPTDPNTSDVSQNTAAGSNALLNVNPAFGTNNTAVGYDALYANTSGSFNTANGALALSGNTSGEANTATGVSALRSNTNGGYNTASGLYSLYSNTTGNYNVASGYASFYSNTTGSSNVAFGNNALEANNIGVNNVGIGAYTLYQLHSGHGNIAVGFKAGQWTKVGSNNIYIGHYGNSAGTESNVTRIGIGQTKTFIAGIKGVALKGATVVVNAAGQLGVVASSARYKMNIYSLTDASAKLAQLRPVSYEYKTEPGATHYGLVAEEVDKVMPELVVRDEDNRPESVQYQELVPLLLQQVTSLKARLDRDEAELAQLRQAPATDSAIAKH